MLNRDGESKVTNRSKDGQSCSMTIKFPQDSIAVKSISIDIRQCTGVANLKVMKKNCKYFGDSWDDQIFLPKPVKL